MDRVRGQNLSTEFVDRVCRQSLPAKRGDKHVSESELHANRSKDDCGVTKKSDATADLLSGSCVRVTAILSTLRYLTQACSFN